MAEGCYKDLYLPASFKGVPFEAIEVTSEGGRRGAEGEFPFGEVTAYADLGRRIRVYTLTGRFVRNSHILDAALLIAACELPGPGPLLHPTRGLVFVACKSVKVTDDLLEGKGITNVSLEFVEANDWISGLNFGANLFGFALTGIFLVLTATFAASYHPKRVRFFRVQSVLNTSADAVRQVRDQFALVTAANRDVKVSRALADLDTVIEDPFTLRDTEVMSKALTLGMNAIDVYSGGTPKYQAMKTLANWSAKVSTQPGEAGETENAVYTMVRTLSAIYMAKAAMETSPETLDQAFVQYDEVMTVLSDETAIAKNACDNVLFLELRTLASQVQDALLNRAYNLPAIIQYNFSSSVSSLFAAYEIFGDAKRFKEIETRNTGGWPFSVGPIISAAVS